MSFMQEICFLRAVELTIPNTAAWAEVINIGQLLPAKCEEKSHPKILATLRI